MQFLSLTFSFSFFTRNGEIFKEVTDGRLLAGPGHVLQDSGRLHEYTMELYCTVNRRLSNSKNPHACSMSVSNVMICSDLCENIFLEVNVICVVSFKGQ